jgi:long-chain-fatty-acid--CoA ligase ACSBG
MMGYLGNPDLGEEHIATITKKLSEAIDKEGWCHSGDQGAKDERGMVKITGRYKELIIGAGGENIAPVPIEDRVKELCPAISNILMIGDQRKFNVALVTLKAVGATGEQPGTNDLDGAAATLVDGVKTITGAANNEAYIKAITDAIVGANNDGSVTPSNAAKIQKFTILPHDFSVDGGELTPTLKTKRSVVDKTYKDVIDHMYSSKETYVKHPSLDGKGGAAEAGDAPAPQSAGKKVSIG